MTLFGNRGKYGIRNAIFATILVLALTLTTISSEALAENTSSIAEGDLIEIGNKGVNGYKGTPLWRVIGKESNGNLLLLSEHLWIGNGTDSNVGIRFNDGQTKNINGQVFHWRGTDAETWCKGFEESVLNGIPELTIVPATKSDEEYIYTQTLYAEGNNKEIRFTAADTILYQNGVYFLSAEEVATYIPNPADRKSSIPGNTDCEQWLLRSTQNGTEWAAEIKPDGEITAVRANTRRAVRPAFKAKFEDGASFVSIINENGQKVWTIGDEQGELTGGNQNPKENNLSKDKSTSIKTVAINTKTVNAKTIQAAILAAGAKTQYVTQIEIGRNVKKISKNAFKGSNITTVVVKSKKLKKKTVKGSFKGSKVKTVKVKVGNKQLNKKYVKRYKKIFTKKNVGKKVKVKR